MPRSQFCSHISRCAASYDNTTVMANTFVSAAISSKCSPQPLATPRSTLQRHFFATQHQTVISFILFVLAKYVFRCSQRTVYLCLLHSIPPAPLIANQQLANVHAAHSAKLKNVQTYSGTFNLLFTYSLNISSKQKHLRNLFTHLHINIKYLRLNTPNCIQTYNIYITL